MSMHSWTDYMAAIRLPDALPSQEAYETFIDNHASVVNELFDKSGCDVPENIRDVEDYYENDLGMMGIGPLVADVINVESQWTVDYASDYNTPDTYIGVYAGYDFPWTPKSQFNSGMTPDILESLVNGYIRELWGTTGTLDQNVTITSCG